MEKQCSSCAEVKPLSEFHRKAHNKDGYSGTCRACANAYYANNRKANQEHVLAREAAYRASKREALAEYRSNWRKENVERVRASVREAMRKQYVPYAEWPADKQARHAAYSSSWRKRNKPKEAARVARRYAGKKQATPGWAESFFIEEAYALAKLRTEMFGFEWHVDHVIPLRGKTVCGLHVIDNLRVIPGAENMRKSNKLLEAV